MKWSSKTLYPLQRRTRRLGRLLCGCVVAGVAVPHVASAEVITAFAASSLRDAVGDIAAVYSADTGVEVVLVFAASSSIARQVAQGAPADVVLLADQAWADWLVNAGAVDTVTPFAGNTLVVAGSGAPMIADAGDIPGALAGGLLAMAQVDAVPAGRYGKAALVSLGLWDDLSAQVVQAANVRAALRFVERGEVAMGIGYASDLVALPDLAKLYEFAPDTHPPIVYSAASVTPHGSEFMVHLQSVGAQDILGRWGFTPVGDAR